MPKPKHNFKVIELVDSIDGTLIYKVQCVCGKIGNISEVAMSVKISCGCSKIIRENIIGVTRYSYKFMKFAHESNQRHFYEIFCSKCEKTNIVNDKYNKKRCPTCPEIIEGVEVDLHAEAKRLGMSKNALLDRLKRHTLQEALDMPKTKRGGYRSRYGRVTFRGVFDYIPAHLRKWEIHTIRTLVYNKIRAGVSPVDALEFYVARKESRESSCGAVL